MSDLDDIHRVNRGLYNNHNSKGLGSIEETLLEKEPVKVENFFCFQNSLDFKLFPRVFQGVRGGSETLIGSYSQG